MLTTSPELYPNLGWQLEEEMIDELYYDESSPTYNLKGIDTSNQSLGISTQPDIEVDDPFQPNSTKKLSHNAYERDRRKKLNYLYCSLRSLLPDTDQSKKLSIPTTIARVLKYIPELQRSVDRLRRRKEEMLSRALRTGESSLVLHDNLACPVISVTRLDNAEVMIQICISSKTTGVHFSRVLRLLEEEDLQLLNASTFTTPIGKTFYSLHLQAKNSVSFKGQGFCEQLMKTLKEQRSLRQIGNLMYV